LLKYDAGLILECIIKNNAGRIKQPSGFSSFLLNLPAVNIQPFEFNNSLDDTTSVPQLQDALF
jgi:hypothetical protein